MRYSVMIWFDMSIQEKCAFELSFVCVCACTCVCVCVCVGGGRDILACCGCAYLCTSLREGALVCPWFLIDYGHSYQEAY
jgi:hypothetical protein